MNSTPLTLIALILLFPACQSSAKESPSESVEPTASYDHGLPRFQSVQDAIYFAVEESNLASYKGVVFGSERFEIDLPSGAVTNNWLIACYFRDLFKPFGSDAYGELAPLLQHRHDFVGWGAYFVLQPYMNSHGLKRHTRDSPDERRMTLQELQVLLAQD